MMSESSVRLTPMYYCDFMYGCVIATHMLQRVGVAQADLCHHPYTRAKQTIVFNDMVHLQVAGAKDWIFEPETIDGVNFVEIQMKRTQASAALQPATPKVSGVSNSPMSCCEPCARLLQSV